MGLNTYPQNPFPPSSEAAGGTVYELPIASTTELGGVKVGSGLAINAETGVLINNYELPMATPEELGGVIVDTDSGLYCTGGYIGVKVKNNGNLFFDSETGELFAYSWTPPAITINETETGEYFGSSKVYQKLIDMSASPVALTHDTWVSTGASVANIDTLLGATVIAVGTDLQCVLSHCEVGIVDDLIKICLVTSVGSRSAKYVILKYTKTTT